MKNPIRVKRLAGALAVLLITAPAFAQQTSSNLAGRVTDNEGVPLAGAEIIIVHTPTGTTSRATTDAQGRYSARGLRVGGPYTVTVTREGFKGESTENVFLALGETSSLNMDLDTAMTELGVVEVVATAASTVFSPENMGTGTVVSAAEIAALPSAGRNIQDLIRVDPRVAQTSKADGRISAGGQNTRYNLIRIDGVSTNDPFGLEANGMPTERQPVSMDAIEEVNIALANYDVTTSGATGAVVNAVTKSGSNEFHGSAYYAYRDKDWVRKRLNGVEFNGFNDEKTYGGTLGGFLVRDRLFFFANYEKFVRSVPGTSLASTPYGRGAITAADIAEAQRIARDVWGFDAGSLASPSGDTEIEEYALKLDWNINDNHRASLRYSKMEQDVLRQPGISNSSLSLSSYWYNHTKRFESWVGQLYSDWSDNFSTELKVSYRDFSAIRNTSSNLPSIRVNFDRGDLLFGTEVNSHVNLVDTTEKSLFAAGTYYLGDHALKFGVDHAENDVLNYYGRDRNGSYTFASLADFAAGTPSRYSLRVPRPGRGYEDIPASYLYKTTGVFLQDNWSVNYNLNLLLGVRLDIPKYDTEPLHNPAVTDLYGYDNRVTLDKKLWQPRFGFNYTFDSDYSTQLRGGIGLFQGAAPNVWMAGVFQNTGLNFVSYDERNPGAIFTPNVNPPYIPAGPGSAPRMRVDVAEPGLALPSVWKANLALDRELPWHGIVASAELLLLSTRDDIYIESLGLGAPTFAGQDGRQIFWNDAGMDPGNVDGNRGIRSGRNGARDRSNRPRNVDQVMLLRNTKKGEAQQLTLSLSKPQSADGNWSWTAGYTYTHATQVSPMASSQNTSNWGGMPIHQANENLSSTSRYAIRDRFTGMLAYSNAFFGDNQTTVGLIYEGRSGLPYSHVFRNDANGDGTLGNDLFYVPAGRGDVLFTGGAAMENAFFEWLAQHPELARHAGRVVPANSNRSSWVNNFDLRISQQLPAFFEGHKAELSFDLMNVGNLLNKKWGQIEDYGFYQTRQVLDYAGIDPASGRYVYDFDLREVDDERIQENNNDKGNTGVSRWSVMATFKYRF